MLFPFSLRPAKEYALTLDMAKELSMVERPPEGFSPIPAKTTKS
jgi:hypothetical protein